MIFIIITLILIILFGVFSIFFDIADVIGLMLSSLPELSWLKRKPLPQKNNFNEKIKTLVRQSARWAIAAEQDENPYIAMLHANYGAGYIFALRSIASDAEIKSATKVDARQLEKAIIKIQDQAFRNLAQICPDGQPKSQFLRVISGEGI